MVHRYERRVNEHNLIQTGPILKQIDFTQGWREGKRPRARINAMQKKESKASCEECKGSIVSSGPVVVPPFSSSPPFGLLLYCWLMKTPISADVRCWWRCSGPPLFNLSHFALTLKGHGNKEVARERACSARPLITALRNPMRCGADQICSHWSVWYYIHEFTKCSVLRPERIVPLLFRWTLRRHRCCCHMNSCIPLRFLWHTHQRSPNAVEPETNGRAFRRRSRATFGLNAAEILVFVAMRFCRWKRRSSQRRIVGGWPISEDADDHALSVFCFSPLLILPSPLLFLC